MSCKDYPKYVEFNSLLDLPDKYNYAIYGVDDKIIFGSVVSIDSPYVSINFTFMDKPIEKFYR